MDQLIAYLIIKKHNFQIHIYINNFCNVSDMKSFVKRVGRMAKASSKFRGISGLKGDMPRINV